MSFKLFLFLLLVCSCSSVEFTNLPEPFTASRGDKSKEFPAGVFIEKKQWESHLLIIVSDQETIARLKLRNDAFVQKEKIYKEILQGKDELWEQKKQIEIEQKQIREDLNVLYEEKFRVKDEIIEVYKEKEKTLQYKLKGSRFLQKVSLVTGLWIGYKVSKILDF